MFDLVIRGSTLATASDVFEADIGIRDGRIAQIGVGLTAGAREIDASGRYVLPGGIDSHVHFAQPSAMARSTIVLPSSPLPADSDAMPASVPI